MAWIAIKQKIRDDPQTLDLMDLMSWELDKTIGKIVLFMLWCVDHAENGDLRSHNDNRLGTAVGCSPGDESRRFVEALVQSRWLEREPYFRIRNWWSWVGQWLLAKYKRNPEKWDSVRKLYVTVTQQYTERENRENKPTPLPPFGEFWAVYPKRVGKAVAEKAWAKIAPDKPLFERMKATLETQKRSDQWRKDGGQFIPHPATWLNQRRWEDEVQKVRDPDRDKTALEEVRQKSGLSVCCGAKFDTYEDRPRERFCATCNRSYRAVPVVLKSVQFSENEQDGKIKALRGLK